MLVGDYDHKWSASKILVTSDCMMNYYIIYEMKLKPLMNGPMAAGRHIHRKKEKFYIQDKSGLVRPRYKSAETFASAAGREFIRAVTRGGMKDQVKWRDKKEMFIMKSYVEKICKGVYDRFEDEGPPVYVELPFKYVRDRRLFTGFIDEVRKGPVIRDYKSGKKRPKEMTRIYNPQFTLYVVSLGFKCMEDPAFAESLGISPEEAMSWRDDPDFMFKHTDLEYHHMHDDEIIPLERGSMQYEELLKTLKGWEKRIDSGEIYAERGEKCNWCDTKDVCDLILSPRDPSRRMPVQRDLFRELDFLEGLDEPGDTSRVIVKLKKPYTEYIRKHRQVGLRFK
jgi:hypothetical protein